MQKVQNKKRRLALTAAVAMAVMIFLALFVSISEVVVTGNGKYTEEEIVNILFPDRMSKNSLLCFLKNHFQEHVQIPFVEDPDEELETVEREAQEAAEQQQKMFGLHQNTPPDEEEDDDIKPKKEEKEDKDE